MSFTRRKVLDIGVFTGASALAAALALPEVRVRADYNYDNSLPDLIISSIWIRIQVLTSYSNLKFLFFFLAVPLFRSLFSILKIYVEFFNLQFLEIFISVVGFATESVSVSRRASSNRILLLHPKKKILMNFSAVGTFVTVLWIRIRILIQHFKSIRIRFQIQGFDDQKLNKKIQLKKCFFC
jgi:hypothetical protein